MFFGDEDHKKISTLIVGKRNMKGERTMEPTAMKGEVVKHEDGEIDGRHLAMQDFIAAHHEKSASKMVDSLANFLDIHMAQRYDSGEPDKDV